LGVLDNPLKVCIRFPRSKRKFNLSLPEAALGSSFGPLLGNIFRPSIEESLEHEGKCPSFYLRYADFAIVTDLLHILSHVHFSVKFAMETGSNGMLPFLGIHFPNQAT